MNKLHTPFMLVGLVFFFILLGWMETIKQYPVLFYIMIVWTIAAFIMNHFKNEADRKAQIERAAVERYKRENA